MPSLFDRLLGGKKPAAQPAAPPPNPPAGGAPSSSPPSACYDDLLVQAINAAAAGNFPRAIELYNQTIAADPSRAEGYYKRGNALKDSGRLEAAVASYDLAIERKPDHSHAYCNRGSVQRALGRTLESLASYEAAIAIDPTDVFAHYNRGLGLQDFGRWDESLAAYERALEINPEFADAQYNRALNLLFMGDFGRGWRAYEWRWKVAQRLGIGERRDAQRPPWLGEESIEGKRLLLYSEAGLGDTLQFCRYATLCAARGATVYLEAQAPLLDLLGNLEGVAQVIARGSLVPPFDFHCPLMSLPLALKTTLEDIPAPARYLHPDPARVARWRESLGERTRPRIGLTWSGNPRNPIDARRSIALAEWLPHLPAEYQYFCLQTQLRESDLETLDSSELIFAFDDDALDFAGTAALCECMDLIISVDTSIAHLAGALGRPTWVPLSHTPDWRWLRGRTDSPWYPSIRLYRQASAGDWNPVLERIAADLRRELGGA